jgi:hypothetical protein
MQAAKEGKAKLPVTIGGIDVCVKQRNKGAVLVLAKFTRKERQQRIFCLRNYQSYRIPRPLRSDWSCSGDWKTIPVIPRRLAAST